MKNNKFEFKQGTFGDYITYNGKELTREEILQILNKNKQLRIGGVVRSAVKKTKTVWLDDTWFGIQINGDDIKADNRFEFAEIVNILLTDKQQKAFMADDTNRGFEVSKKRIDKMFAYINSDNNVWRKK